MCFNHVVNVGYTLGYWRPTVGGSTPVRDAVDETFFKRIVKSITNILIPRLPESLFMIMICEVGIVHSNFSVKLTGRLTIVSLYARCTNTVIRFSSYSALQCF